MAEAKPPKQHGSAFRGIALAPAAGYALLLVACQLTEWGGLGLSDRTGAPLLSILQFWTVPLLLAMGASLLGCSALTLRRVRIPAQALGVAGALLMVLGYLLLILAGSAGEGALLASSLVIGAGTGCFLASWTAFFARRTLQSTTATVLCALALYAVVFLALSFTGSTVREAAYLLCILLSGGTLFACLHTHEAKPTTGDSAFSPRAHPNAITVLKAIRKPLFCAGAIGFAVAVTRTMTLHIHLELVGDSGVACVFLFATGLLAFTLTNRQEPGRKATDETSFSIPGLFGIVFPVVATLLLALSLFGNSLAVPVSAITFALYMIVQSLMVSASLEAAESNGLPALSVYGAFAGCVYVVFALATALGIFLFGLDGDLSASAPLLAGLLVLYVFAMAYAFVRRSSIRGEEDAGRQPGSSHSATNPNISEERAAASAQAQAPEAAAVGGPAEAPDPISLRCQTLIERFELSPRESEVLVAFAHGRNVSYLAQTLVLSPNTIRTHSKTLYAKLGVHSKQELVTLVEQQPLSPAPSAITNGDGPSGAAAPQESAR